MHLSAFIFIPERFLKKLGAILPLSLLCLAVCAPLSAHAAMIYCNRTRTPIEAALGYRENDKFVSEGWWQIEPGQCARVYGQPFTQRFYYYYGTALASTGKDAAGKDLPPFVWSGKYGFCTDTKAFRVEGDGDCEAQGYQTRGFQQIDLGTNSRDYTLDFKDGSEDDTSTGK